MTEMERALGTCMKLPYQEKTLAQANPLVDAYAEAHLGGVGEQATCLIDFDTKKSWRWEVI